MESSACISKIHRILNFLKKEMTGAELIAESLNEILDEDAVIYGVPGSPVTGIIDWFDKNSENKYRGFVDYEELDMLRHLVGINSHGIPTIGIMKHSGFLTVQELMATLVNYELRSPFIIVVGDESGASSQTGNDTRYLCDSTKLIVVEPSLTNITECLTFCLEVSSQLRKPVVLRVIDSLVKGKQIINSTTKEICFKLITPAFNTKDYFATEGLTRERYNQMTIMKKCIKSNLKLYSQLNRFYRKNGKFLVIASGNIVDKAINIAVNLDGLDFLEINTINLLPEEKILEILKHYNRVLILESWEPYLENKIRSLVQRYELNEIIILGREENQGKESFIISEDIEDLSNDNLAFYLKAFNFESLKDEKSILLKSYKNYPFITLENNNYVEIFRSFKRAAEELKLEPCLSVSTGNTRYSVQNTEFEAMVKFMGPMGSEVWELFGYLDFLPNYKKVAAGLVLGDYTFSHSAWKGVCTLDKYQNDTGRKVVTIIIDNHGSLTTGGQSCQHPASLGQQFIKNWETRLIGTVKVNDSNKTISAIKTMLDTSNNENILIIEI
mgnify:CR=1 FL=1